jgi:hypothetical protein
MNSSYNSINVNVETLNRFYDMLTTDRPITFAAILCIEKRMKELDAITFPAIANCVTALRQMKMAELLSRKSEDLGLTDSDEIAYVYIKNVDPTLSFYELYETFKEDKKGLRDMCFKKFGLYDPKIISLEKAYVDGLYLWGMIQEDEKGGR